MADLDKKGGVDLEDFIRLMKELGLIPPKEIKFWEFDKPNEFTAKFDELKAIDDLFIAYLTSPANETTGESWCPDSDAVRQDIIDHVLEKTSLVVIKGNVNEKTAWTGVGTHPFKTHSLIQARELPLLLLVGNGGQVLLRAQSKEDFNSNLLSSICEGEWKLSDHDIINEDPEIMGEIDAFN